MKTTISSCARSLWITLTLSVAFTSGLATHAQAGQDSPFVGNWQMSTKANTAEKRLITLNRSKGQLWGFYMTKAGRKEPITRAKYVNQTLSFQVPGVRLQFRNVRFVKGHLEGEVIDANPGQMSSIPQPVRLVRVQN
jgi:hypothetical protein